MNLHGDGVRTMPQPQQPSVGMYRRIAVGFVALAALAVAFVAYVVLGRATVVVLSKQLDVEDDFVLDVSAKPSEKEVPGAAYEDSETLTQSFPSTSVVKVDAPAEGRVRISSTLFRSQTLIASTRLLTPDGVLFRIKETVVVPANGSAQVDAFADEPGMTGDVGNVTFTIPGLNPDTRRFFTVETVEPMTGGQKDVRMVTAKDVAAAEAVLREKLEMTLAERLQAKAKEAGVQSSGEMIAYDVTKKVTDIAVGTEAEEFTLTFGLKATAVFYDKAKLAEAARAHLASKLPTDRVLTALHEDSITTDVEKVDLIAGRANLRVTAKGTSVMSPDAPALDRERLVGVTAEAAKAYIENIDGVASASVRVTPIWAGRMPNVADHITIEVR